MVIRWAFIKSYAELLWYLFNDRDSEEKTYNWRPWARRKATIPLVGKQVDFKSETILHNGRPPLFAITIGINNYEDNSLSKLHGAVADADAIEQYLVHDLKVPPDQIISLRNHYATRKAIINAFIQVAEDSRVRMNDPILIFYAGHGGEAKPKEEGAEPIQTIFPQDYIRGNPEVAPIPDRTIGALINKLAELHGNNITVIFDCCHSGSGSRGDDDEPNSLVRSGPVAIDDIPPNLDQDICGATRGIRIANGFAHRGIRSHILLAACSAYEPAREDFATGGGRGRFTVALLKLLRTVGPEQLVYSDVLKRIDPIPDQNPQCEGFFRTRVFFDAKAPSPARSCHQVKYENDKYILQAGSAHGITPEAEFTVYESKEAVLAKPSLVVMTTDKIGPFTTVLKPVSSGSLPGAFKPGDFPVALQTKVGVAEDFRLHVPIHQTSLPIFKAVIEEMKGIGPNPCRITLVPLEKAQMEMSMDQNGSLTFKILDERLVKYGISQIPHALGPNPDATKLRSVLRAAAHYTFHLNHAQQNNQIQKNIAIKFMRLFVSDSEYDEGGFPVVVPDDKNLIGSGVINVVAEEDTTYGVEIRNGTPWNLHFHCLYFDNMDLSITAFTSSDNLGIFDADYMLRPRTGVATFGYGPLGLPAFQCDVPDGVQTAAGFFKFYFTTEPVDLSHVPQRSPFEDTRAITRVKQQQPLVWGSILIPVIQRRE